MGNASNLRKNPTWSLILDEMEKEGQIGFGFPIVCPRHPGKAKIVSEPKQLPKIAPLGTGKSYAFVAPYSRPTGGCLIPCGYKLSCGHICPSLVRKGTFTAQCAFLPSSNDLVSCGPRQSQEYTLLRELCALSLHTPAPLCQTLLPALRQLRVPNL